MAFSFGKPAGSLFGNTTTTTTTTNTAPGTSLFGNTGSATQAAPSGGSTTGGSLFGSIAPQPAKTGGLFGSSAPAAQPAQPAQSGAGSLFGNTGAASAQPASTGLFGSTPAQPAQPAQQQQGSSLFGGGGTTAGTSASLFGQPQQQTGQQPSIGLFGSTSQPQTGQQPSTGLFGSTAQPQPYGSTSKPQSNLFASTSAAPGLFSTKPEQDIGTRILAVKNAWDTQSPECRFKYYFYNVVEPGTASRYGRPPTAVDEEKWNRAQRENPDPENMVPVLATGWADVKKRMQMQEAIASVHQERVREITKALQELTTTTTLSSSQRLSNLQHRLSTLQHRLIKLAGQTPAYNPHFQSTAIRPEEAATQAILENVKAELDGRGKSAVKSSGALGVSTGTPRRHPSEGRLAGQVNELWGQVEEIRRRKKGVQSNGVDDVAWLSDEKVLQEIAEILSRQQYALQKLKALADDSLFDADVIRQGLNAIERP